MKRNEIIKLILGAIDAANERIAKYRKLIRESEEIMYGGYLKRGEYESMVNAITTYTKCLDIALAHKEELVHKLASIEPVERHPGSVLIGLELSTPDSYYVEKIKDRGYIYGSIIC